MILTFLRNQRPDILQNDPNMNLSNCFFMTRLSLNNFANNTTAVHAFNAPYLEACVSGSMVSECPIMGDL